VAIEFQIYCIGLTAAGTAPESSGTSQISPDSLLDCFSNKKQSPNMAVKIMKGFIIFHIHKTNLYIPYVMMIYFIEDA
jgi:hypothetical protein